MTRNRAFLAAGVLVALLLAGVVSFWASSSPDGLERVAEDTGFIGTAEDHDLADSPFADYGTAGVDDARLSGGLAGGSDNGEVAQFLATSRLGGERALSDRLARAVDEGDLPAGTDPAALARYVMTVSEGNAVHAAAGVDRAGLNATIDIALRAIPR